MKTTVINHLNQTNSFHDIQEYNFDTLASELFEISELRKYLEEKETSLKRKIENYLIDCNQTSWVGQQFIFSKSFRKGAIDYTAIPELKHIDLEKYRKDSVACWKLTKI